MKSHADGVYCKAVDDTIQWYSLSANMWTNIDAPYEMTLSASHAVAGGVFMVRDAELVSLEADGSETSVAQLPASLGGSHGFYVLEDQLILPHFTLWRQLR